MDENNYYAYQADVHFALATIIQGITIAFLGVAFANLIKSPSWPQTGILLLTSLESLILAISFWYGFVMAYFHLYRVLKMTAVDHLVLAYIYFSIGLLQIIGFQFLDNPRLWLTINSVFLGTTLFNALYIRHMSRRESESVYKSLNIQPITKSIIATFSIITLLLILWYAWPALDSTFYAFMCLLTFAVLTITYNIVAVRSFQSRLDVQNLTNSAGS